MTTDGLLQIVYYHTTYTAVGTYVYVYNIIIPIMLSVVIFFLLRYTHNMYTYRRNGGGEGKNILYYIFVCIFAVGTYTDRYVVFYLNICFLQVRRDQPAATRWFSRFSSIYIYINILDNVYIILPYIHYNIIYTYILILYSYLYSIRTTRTTRPCYGYHIIM